VPFQKGASTDTCKEAFLARCQGATPLDAQLEHSQDPSAKHMVVMCRGQFYWFDVLDDNSDLIMTEKDISLNLQAVLSTPKAPFAAS
jgi:hypothetical protein